MSPLKAVLVVLLIVILFGLPVWPYSSNWSYYPSGAGTVLLLALLFFLLVRRR